MLRPSLLAAALTLVALSAGQAGTLAPGGQPWQTSDCFKPNPPWADRSEAMGLNNTVAAYDAYLTKVNEYYACINAEVARDQQRIQAGAARALNDAHQEAISAQPFKSR